MPFDSNKVNSPASKGDVAGIAIKTSIALSVVARALEELRQGKDISKHIEEIYKRSRDLDDAFDELTGWKPNE